MGIPKKLIGAPIPFIINGPFGILRPENIFVISDRIYVVKITFKIFRTLIVNDNNYYKIRAIRFSSYPNSVVPTGTIICEYDSREIIDINKEIEITQLPAFDNLGTSYDQGICQVFYGLNFESIKQGEPFGLENTEDIIEFKIYQYLGD